MAKVFGCLKSESTKQIETWIAEFEDEIKQEGEKKAKVNSEEEGHPT